MRTNSYQFDALKKMVEFEKEELLQYYEPKTLELLDSAIMKESKMEFAGYDILNDMITKHQAKIASQTEIFTEMNNKKNDDLASFDWKGGNGIRLAKEIVD